MGALINYRIQPGTGCGMDHRGHNRIAVDSTMCLALLTRAKSAQAGGATSPRVFVANPFERAAMKQGAKSEVTVKRDENFRLQRCRSTKVVSLLQKDLPKMLRFQGCRLFFTAVSR